MSSYNDLDNCNFKAFLEPGRVPHKRLISGLTKDPSSHLPITTQVPTLQSRPLSAKAEEARRNQNHEDSKEGMRSRQRRRGGIRTMKIAKRDSVTSEYRSFIPSAESLRDEIATSRVKSEHAKERQIGFDALDMAYDTYLNRVEEDQLMTVTSIPLVKKRCLDRLVKQKILGCTKEPVVCPESTWKLNDEVRLDRKIHSKFQQAAKIQLDAKYTGITDMATMVSSTAGGLSLKTKGQRKIAVHVKEPLHRTLPLPPDLTEKCQDKMERLMRIKPHTEDAGMPVGTYLVPQWSPGKQHRQTKVYPMPLNELTSEGIKTRPGEVIISSNRGLNITKDSRRYKPRFATDMVIEGLEVATNLPQCCILKPY